MSRRQYLVALIVLAVSGLIGGALSTSLLPVQTAWAQAPSTSAQTVTAQCFVVVDDEGNERGRFGTNGGVPTLSIRDVAGTTRVELECMGGMLPGLYFYDFQGDLTHLITGSGLSVMGGLYGETAKLANDGLSLVDAEGKRLTLGVVRTEDPGTGAVTRHPVSTITLFDGNGNVRWQVP